MASAFHPVDGHSAEELAAAAQLASLADEIPEGRSIVVLAKERFNLRERELGADHQFVPFSAYTRMSGLDYNGAKIRKGAADAGDGGTNLGPRSKVLVEDVRKQIARLKREGITPTEDLVTSSGSGIDPDIEPVDAYAQVNAVAKANGLPVAAVRHLIATHVQSRELGFLGSPYINVLALNRALAQLKK